MKKPEDTIKMLLKRERRIISADITDIEWSLKYCTSLIAEIKDVPSFTVNRLNRLSLDLDKSKKRLDEIESAVKWIDALY